MPSAIPASEQSELISSTIHAGTGNRQSKKSRTSAHTKDKKEKMIITAMLATIVVSAITPKY